MKKYINRLLFMLGYEPIKPKYPQFNPTIVDKKIMQIRSVYNIPQDMIIGHIDPKIVENSIKYEVNQKLLSTLTELIDYQTTTKSTPIGNEYIIVDTLKTSKNAFGNVLEYDIIIKLNQDSTLHYSRITDDGTLVQVSVLPLKPEQWKK